MNNSPISSGGINGHIKKTESWLKVSEITLKLSHFDAHLLCNLLNPEKIVASGAVESQNQVGRLVSLGEALAQCLDHPNLNLEKAIYNKPDKGESDKSLDW